MEWNACKTSWKISLLMANKLTFIGKAIKIYGSQEDTGCWHHMKNKSYWWNFAVNCKIYWIFQYLYLNCRVKKGLQNTVNALYVQNLARGRSLSWPSPSSPWSHNFEFLHWSARAWGSGLQEFPGSLSELCTQSHLLVPWNELWWKLWI